MGVMTNSAKITEDSENPPPIEGSDWPATDETPPLMETDPFLPS